MSCRLPGHFVATFRVCNSARSSAQMASFVLAKRPQGNSRAYANSNPPYLLQQSQTSLHAPMQARRNQKAPTNAHQPKKPDPSLRTAHSSVGGSAFIVCCLPGHFAAPFRVCNSARSSAQTALFVLVMRPQGKSRASANSNPPYLLQQSQHEPPRTKASRPQILTNASTPKPESTNQRTPTQKPDPSLCTAHSSVGGSAFKPCRLPRHFAAPFRVCNSARSSTQTFVLVIRPQVKSREYANSNPSYLLQQSHTSRHAPRQADPNY
jgi:hypothetical protein